MAEWFNQSRYDLNGNSTKESFDRAAEVVDAAREFARMATWDVPGGRPGRLAEQARAVISGLFSDAPAASVLKTAGLTEPPMLRAIDEARFDAVLRDLKAANQVGMTRDLPEGEGLTRNGIDAQARYDGRAPKIIEQAQAEGRALPESPEKTEAAKQGLRAVEVSLVGALQAQAPRGEVIEGVDRVLAAAQRYWQASIASGRQIIAAKEQATQQQAGRPAGQPAGQEAKAAITRNV